MYIVTSKCLGTGDLSGIWWKWKAFGCNHL